VAAQAHPVQQALATFIEHTLKSYPRQCEPFDAAFRSPCERGEPYVDDQGRRWIDWQPLPRGPEPADDFAGLERALELTVHPDIKAYYGSFWSGGLEARASDGHVSLIQLWNPADADRLVENLIGHALAKRRARSDFTVFFACTEVESDLFLTVDNASGAVLLEKPGRKPLRTVADDLPSFLDGLVPAPPETHPERRGPPL